MKIGCNDKKRIVDYFVLNGSRSIDEVKEDIGSRIKNGIRVSKTEALIYYYITKVMKK